MRRARAGRASPPARPSPRPPRAPSRSAGRARRPASSRRRTPARDPPNRARRPRRRATPARTGRRRCPSTSARRRTGRRPPSARRRRRCRPARACAAPPSWRAVGSRPPSRGRRRPAGACAGPQGLLASGDPGIPADPGVARPLSQGNLTRMAPFTTTQPAPPLSPPKRLLCGPGPTNVEPSVLEAMREPMLGHLDPVFHDRMLELVEMLQAVYGARAASRCPCRRPGCPGWRPAS